jgi:hypothetical protein
MVSVELRLRSARADEIEAWLPRVEAEYAADIAASGSLPPEYARQKAQSEIRLQLTGPARANQLFFRLIADGQPVGWLWLAVPFPGTQGSPAQLSDSTPLPDLALYRGVGYRVDDAPRGVAAGTLNLWLAALLGDPLLFRRYALV